MDIAPWSGHGPGPTRTLESKHVNLSRYRLPSGALDRSGLSRLIARHLGQVLRHQRHATGSGLAGLPHREALVYQLGGATASELAEFRQLFRCLAKPHKVGGGVLRPEYVQRVLGLP